jgi:hypothetical protein
MEYNMKLKSLVIPVLLSAICATTALAAIPKAPERVPTSWYALESLTCTQGSKQLTFETYIKENIVTRETIDRIDVDGTRFRETHRVWRNGDILVEEIYILSTKGTWMFYSPIEELGVRSAMSRFWKKAGIDENGNVMCGTETEDE